jgi:hypothetical protein
MSDRTQRQIGQFFAFTGPTSTATSRITPPISSSTASAGGVHRIQQFLRDLVSCDRMPRVSEKGIPFLAPASSNRIGKDSAKNRTELTSAKDLKRKLKEVIPNYPICIPSPSPQNRALQHRIGGLWTPTTMKLARDEFVIPEDLKVIFICPEIFDRDLLLRYKQFQTEGGLGVMSPCPKCKQQKFMRHSGWTTMQPSALKILNKELTHDLLIGGVFRCFNFESGCARYVGKDVKKTIKSPSQFTTYSGDLWSQYPQPVQDRYYAYISKIEDRATNVMVSVGFANRLLYHHRSFESFNDDMTKLMDSRCSAAYSAYYKFVKEETMFLAEAKRAPTMPIENFERYKEMNWPSFSDKPIREYFKVPVWENNHQVL